MSGFGGAHLLRGEGGPDEGTDFRGTKEKGLSHFNRQRGGAIRTQKEAKKKLAATEKQIRLAEEIAEGGYEPRDYRRRMAVQEEKLGEKVRFQ